MPQLTVRGMCVDEVKKHASALVEIISDTAKIEHEYVKIFHINSTTVVESRQCIYLELLLLIGRSQEEQNVIVQGITKFFNRQGFLNIQVLVNNVPASDFYENGEHY